MRNNIEIVQVFRMSAEGLTWSQVCLAFQVSSFGSSVEPKYERFLLERGLTPLNTVALATHSVGEREFHLTEGAEAMYFADPTLEGGWYIFREEVVSSLRARSATSGSELIAEKIKADHWRLTLEVPVEEDGTPYEGMYSSLFHDACSAVPIVSDDDVDVWQALMSAYHAEEGRPWGEDFDPTWVVVWPDDQSPPWGFLPIISADGYTAWLKLGSSQVKV